MGIKSKTNISQIMKDLKIEAEKVNTSIVRYLSYVGEYAVTLARNHGNYKDHTGNLRASIGYVVSKNGIVVESGGFDPNAASIRTEGEAGARKGMSDAEIRAKETSGYALVVIAGMNYGVYVEKKQYDVLTFTEESAKALAKQLFRRMTK